MSLRQFLVRGRSALRAFVRPTTFAPGHYYSPITSSADRARGIEWSKSDRVAVPMDLEAMGALAGDLAQHWSTLSTDRRYSPDNHMFPESDALIYHAMIREFRPKRIIEIGSGYSTAVALDTAEKAGLSIELTCIEPYPERLNSIIEARDQLTLHQAFVQEVPLETFDVMESGDILFIDSSHVVKTGSDVVWNMLNILPRLKPGVIVHIHDIFWPFEYKPEWVDEGRDWTEIYLVHAFLVGNSDWEVLFFNDLAWQTFRGLVEVAAAHTAAQRPGGLWLRRVG